MFSVVESRNQNPVRNDVRSRRFMGATMACISLTFVLIFLNKNDQGAQDFDVLVGVHRKDFLSASDARKDLNEYWANLEEKTASLDSRSHSHQHPQQLVEKHEVSSSSNMNTRNRDKSDESSKGASGC